MDKMYTHCVVCNKEFKTYPSRMKVGKGKFCSKGCYLIKNSNSVRCVCKNCGKVYYISASQEGKSYCSRVCMETYLRRTGFWHSKEKHICQKCGSEFITYADRGRKYCSFDCYWSSLKLPSEVRRENQLRYLHKYRYSGNRERVFERDAYKCTRCGTTDHLVVHHKDGRGYKSVGFKNMNNHIDNLITLCASCHNYITNNPL